MAWFKKKTDIVDMSDLHKRGLLPKPAPEKNEAGVVDFSKGSDQTPSTNDDFLGGLANVGSSNPSIYPSPGPVTSRLRDARQKGQINSDVSELRIKLDDSDYKISRLNERVRELERKLREKGI